MITRTSLADEIDLLDADIKILNDSKTAAFKAYREQLAAAGVAKENIAKEIEASKTAIKRRRATSKDEDAVLETEALVDEIYHEITTKSRAPRACIENIEKFDAETGEIIEARQSAIQKHGLAGALSAALGVEVEIVRETNSEMDRAMEGSFETGSEAAEKGREAIPAGPEGVDLNHAGSGESPETLCEYCNGSGDVHRIDGEWLGRCHCEAGKYPSDDDADHAAGANAGGDDVDGGAERATHLVTGEGAACALPAKPKFVLRPYCLKPGEGCGGSGTTHCHSCLKAREEVAA